MILPHWIHAALEARLEGVSRKELAAQAEKISEQYRGKGGSEIIRTEQDALAYALVRMPATYAAVRHALRQTAERAPEFQPTSLLDVGAGPGTASWAALETWDSLRQATLVDRNQPLLEVARLAAVRCESAPALEIAQGNLPEALSKRAPADLVLASYALTELAPAALAEALEKLWTQTTEMLVVVEPGTPEGFRRILQIRAWLIAHAGHIAAPCTHAEGCPLATAERWCHFSQRLPRRRDHLLVKSASVNYEDEKFSYLAVSKTPLRNDAARRILSTPRVDKNAVRLTLCAPDKVEECVIERSDKEAYKKARHYDWGALRAADASGALHAADASGGPAL